MLYGVSCGVCSGVFIVSLFAAFRCRVMLRDEKKLRIGYSTENDERMRLIRSRAGYPFSVVTGAIMTLAGLLFARFDRTAAITAIVWANGQLLVSVIPKAVYSRIL